jgi:hypothetical protein
MNQSENIERVVAAILKTPPKNLLIIQLVNRIPIINGELDYNALSDKQLEINLAIAEAKVYEAHTLQAVDSLVRLKARGEV